MSECLFCKIIAGELPGTFVYEDDDAVAIMDLFPMAEGHSLVIPRVHSTSMEDAEDAVLEKLLPIARKIGNAGLAKFDGVTGYNVHICNGKDAGQVVFHPHVHVIPRRPGDKLGLRHPADYPKQAEPADMQAAADIIKSGL